MTEQYKFPLIDVVLYAKGHYKRTNSIWYDMALCLWKNGEGFGPFCYSDCINKTPQQECYDSRIGICEIVCSRIRKLLVNKPYAVEQLFKHISPQESWKVGYYTKQSEYPFRVSKEFPEWEYWEAVLRAHLSTLAYMSVTDLGYEDWKVFKCTIAELEKKEEE
jgi:hypothetical protein